MTNQTLRQLADIIQESKESIDIDLQADRLTIKTERNSFWILLSVIGIALSTLLIATYNSGQHNLEIGLVILWMSVYGFWTMQSINKTLIIDLRQRTFSVIPNFFLQHWFLTKLLRCDTTFSLNSLPDMQLLYYTRLKYHWTQRIYFSKGIWTIYLLEFDKKETAQKIINLLKQKT